MVTLLYLISELLATEKFHKKGGLNLYKKYIELRDKKGATDYVVAKETGVNKSTFSDWKSGRSNPKIEKLYKIAQFFGVPVEYFITEGE